MLLHAFFAAALSASPTLQTIAESSHFVRSGAYSEVLTFCRSLAERYPSKARCETFGTTPEGRPMQVLTLSDGGSRVVLAQGGIHAGELDGKDAGLALTRDILEGKVLPDILKSVTFVFVPVFNVDGHENMGPSNRPNQLGPETPGFRVNAQRLNLNRDYAKADTPEMRAMLALLRRVDPLVYVDLHTTDGMDFQPDISVTLEPRFGGPASMRAAGKAFSDAMMTSLRSSGHMPLDFYPSTSDENNPLSGWAYGVPPPRFSNGYWPLWDRFGVLVETHSLKTNAKRIQAARDALIGILTYVRDSGGALETAARDARSQKLAGQDVDLAFKASGAPTMLHFPGVAYEVLPSTITGKSWVKFDPKTPKVWETPILTEVKPTLTVKAPRGGYVIPPAWIATFKPTLDAHGVLTTPFITTSSAPRDVFRATHVEVAKQTFEGRTRVDLDGAWARENGEIRGGALFVPIDQPAAAVAMMLLEPKGADSIVRWGGLNAVFEAREYVELNILEPFGQKLLAKDSQVKRDFDALVASGASAEQRIDFFYRRHPANDKLRDFYPVMRVDSAP